MPKSPMFKASLFLLVVLVPAATQSKTWRVRADGTGEVATIQTGVVSAANGDTVLLEAGIYQGLGNRNVNYGGKAVTITSESGPEVTIVDALGARAFCFPGLEGPGSVLSGIKMINCWGSMGGAIISMGSPTITNNIFQNNQSPFGGAIYLEGGAPTIADNTFIGNSASYGGAIYMKMGTPVIAGNTIVYNAAQYLGTGLYITNSSPTIERTIIAFGVGGDGATCADGATPVFSCCDISGNSGSDAICGTDGGGNVSSDPEFCGAPGSDDYYLTSSSPCAPANNACSVQIGAWPIGCTLTPVEESTWGNIKALYGAE